MTVKVHPAADAFPMMNAEQYEGLKQDIAERGQQEAIVYWQGQLVDGRNRLMACQELKIEPTECELDESTDPVAYVISANFHRRHLTTAQRSMVAAKLAKIERGGDRKTDKIKVSIDTLKRDEAAKLLNVSIASVARAKQVVERGSKELVQAVERGEVNLSQAVNLTKAVESKSEQAKLVREGKEAIKAATVSAPKAKAKPKQEAKPIAEASDDEADDYDYPIVKAFEHCDYRIETLRMIFDSLATHELDEVLILLQERIAGSKK